MNTRLIALAATVFLSTTNASFADESTPAWQAPGFVMEEVIAVAPASITTQTLAWQEPGFVMEEVVVTANVSAVNSSTQPRIPPHLRVFAASHIRRHLMQ